MANARVEVIKSVQRRRRWSSAEKEQGIFSGAGVRMGRAR
jgi:hypothetical protein